MTGPQLRTTGAARSGEPAAVISPEQGAREATAATRRFLARGGSADPAALMATLSRIAESVEPNQGSAFRIALGHALVALPLGDRQRLFAAFGANVDDARTPAGSLMRSMTSKLEASLDTEAMSPRAAGREGARALEQFIATPAARRDPEALTYRLFALRTSLQSTDEHEFSVALSNAAAQMSPADRTALLGALEPFRHAASEHRSTQRAQDDDRLIRTLCRRIEATLDPAPASAPHVSRLPAPTASPAPARTASPQAALQAPAPQSASRPRREPTAPPVETPRSVDDNGNPIKTETTRVAANADAAVDPKIAVRVKNLVGQTLSGRTSSVEAGVRMALRSYTSPAEQTAYLEALRAQIAEKGASRFTSAEVAETLRSAENSVLFGENPPRGEALRFAREIFAALRAHDTARGN